MGLDTASVKFLCAARSLGVDFTSTAMIGRQQFFPDPATLQRVFSILGVNHDPKEFLRENLYGERFFALLGAKDIASIDCSSYENASIIHDMNVPIPDDLRERFSAVYDGGTLEHVFNIPQAFKNCMEMVRIGGHFAQANVANNFMGHGFWQFSPELLFGAFSPGNGYQIEVVLLHEVIPGGAWYIVANPDEVRSRVELCNNSPTYILTVARRVARAAIFNPPPLQSDYVARWKGTANNPPQPASNPGGRDTRPRAVRGPIGWRRHLPLPVKRAMRAALDRAFDVYNEKLKRVIIRGFKRPYYKQVSEEDLLRGKLGLEAVPDQHGVPTR